MTDSVSEPVAEDDLDALLADYDGRHGLGGKNCC
jgi:hypothetical protein